MCSRRVHNFAGLERGPKALHRRGYEDVNERRLHGRNVKGTSVPISVADQAGRGSRGLHRRGYEENNEGRDHGRNFKSTRASFIISMLATYPVIR